MKRNKNNCPECGQPCCDKCGSNPCHPEPKASYNEIVNSEGELVVTITRSSFNINADLAYFIWGAMYVANLDGSVLKPYLPAGITVALTTNNQGDLIFTYTQGLNVDRITISTTVLGIISYVEAVQNLQTNYMKSNLMVWGVNGAPNAPVLPQTDINNLLTSGIIMFNIDATTNVGGGKKSHLIIPRSRLSPYNSLTNIVDIYMRREPVKSTTYWINKFAMISGETPPAVTNAFIIYQNEVINVNEEAERIKA